jgi:hypothetical protein
MNNIETTNEVVKNEVVKNEVINLLTKKECKVIVSTINKRMKVACKSFKLSKIDERVINECHTQASCIDACIRAKLDVNDTIDKLVSLSLCTNDKEALKRIKRHKKHDSVSRIQKRNMILNK